MRTTRLRYLVAAVLLAATLGVSATTAADNRARPVLQAVTDPSFVPFEMRDAQSGRMVGFDMAILREVARRAGFDVNLRTMDFSGIIPALQTGNADVAIAGITITKKREKIVDFSDAYYASGLRILRHTGDKSIKKLGDLEGKTVGTKIGSTSADFLREQFGDRIDLKPYPGSADMYLALMGRDLDAVFYDAPNVAYFARTQGDNKVETVGPLYQAQRYGLAFKQNSPWRDAANKALAEMKKDNTYGKLYNKWFGEAPPER